MRNRLHLCLTLLAALAAMAGGNQKAAADVRSFVAVRQELRAELLASMSDGRLDQRERTLLERKAATKLPPGDLSAFRATLSRMGGTPTPAPVATSSPPKP